MDSINEIEDQILDELENIEKAIDKKIKYSQNKDKLMENINEANENNNTSYKNIHEEINNCYNIMERNNVVNNFDDNKKLLNNKLGNVHTVLKSGIQGNVVKFMKNLYEEEKKLY